MKTNGNLLLYTTVRNRDDHDDTPGYYTIGERRFIDVALPLKFVLSTLTDSGFTIVEVNEIPEEARAILCNIEGSDLESVACNEDVAWLCRKLNLLLQMIMNFCNYNRLSLAG